MNNKRAKYSFVVTTINRTARLGLACGILYFAYSRLKFAKAPYLIGDKEERRVVVVGAGFAGLATAYYLTNDPRTHVTLLEKNRFVCSESSSCTGGALLPFASRPATAVKYTNVLTSFYQMTGPSVFHSTKIIWQPAIFKFTWYFLQQGYSW